MSGFYSCHKGGFSHDIFFSSVVYKLHWIALNMLLCLPTVYLHADFLYLCNIVILYVILTK